MNTSDNRAYLASLHSAQIALRGTSDTLEPLYAIPPLVLKRLMPIFNVKEVEPWVKISMHI